MRLAKVEGPPTKNRRRAPRRRASCPAARARNISRPLSLQGRTASDIVREMQAAGAVFKLKPNADRTAWQHAYTVSPGGDRERCRRLLAEVKAQSSFLELFHVACFVAVMRSALDLPEVRR